MTSFRRRAFGSAFPAPLKAARSKARPLAPGFAPVEALKQRVPTDKLPVTRFIRRTRRPRCLSFDLQGMSRAGRRRRRSDSPHDSNGPLATTVDFVLANPERSAAVEYVMVKPIQWRPRHKALSGTRLTRRRTHERAPWARSFCQCRRRPCVTCSDATRTNLAQTRRDRLTSRFGLPYGRWHDHRNERLA